MESRTFILDGYQTVSFKDDQIKNYSFIGECFYATGERSYCGLFLREDGQFIDPLDLSKKFPEELYDEDGKLVDYNEDFFLMDSTRGVEYNNKLYILETLEEVN